jgi:putative lipase involved disintegration of autophagic bodies
MNKNSSRMDKKIDLIIDELCKHETTKQEAKERLLILFGVVSSSDESKEALNEAVTAIYFNDNSDYLRALYAVIRKLTGVNDLYSSTGNIDKLFKELNPDD